MNRILFSAVVLLSFLLGCNHSENKSKIDLSGQWQFRMDPNDVGESEMWFNENLTETVQLPGSMNTNGKGNDITMETIWTGGMKDPDWYTRPYYAPFHDPENVRIPFWLQPNKKYYGAAWYRKSVHIPDSWVGSPVFLHLERPHWESVVWVNGSRVDMQNSLSTPHHFDISEWVKAGENSISIRIDNRTKDIDVGENSHSISDHTQSNWNGIVGEISIYKTDKIYIDHLEVFPDTANKSVMVNATVINHTEDEVKVKVKTLTRLKKSGMMHKEQTLDLTIVPGENIIPIDYSLGQDALLWDEFNPNVYELSVQIVGQNINHENIVDFGLREFKTEGTRFSINGRPVFLRGTLECAIFPLTGYPPTSVEDWIKVYQAVKDHGLNHVRFHSWCPPRAAFVAADEMGIYLQVECSSWPNQSTELGSGLPIDQYIWDESKAIVKEYGSHPSFVLMSSGNEPGGQLRDEYLTEFVNYWKEKDTRRIYTSAAGWPVISANQFHNIPDPRIQGWGEELNSIINAQPPQTNFDWGDKVTTDGKPVVSHEIGQWCVYPNFKEIEKYTGVLKPRNFEIFRESLNANNLGHLADSFLLASGKLQALCYKADIEAALRTPGFAGFQLLDLHDFPGQGTALVGVLDPFWEEKGYISPEEYRQFSNTVVPLARLEKRIFSEGETLRCAVEVSNFGEKPLSNATLTWRILENNEVAVEGVFDDRIIPIDNCIELGNIQHQFAREDRPRKLTIEVSVNDFANSWEVWVYPADQDYDTENVRVTDKLDQNILSFLEDGGSVLLSLGKGKVSPEMGGDVGVGFSSIFWNTAWTGGQKPHTLGILCNPAHPALAHFPTDYYSDWQWWDAMSTADAIQIDGLYADIAPIVRIIDDWVTNRSLALLFEVKVGEGKMLISGTDLLNDLENRPEARQLLLSLKKYMDGDQFNPQNELAFSQLQKIVR
jgi:hypothetical protein